MILRTIPMGFVERKLARVIQQAYCIKYNKEKIKLPFKEKLNENLADVF